VPLVIGTNAHEFGLFIPASLIPPVEIASCAEYATVVTGLFPGIAVRLLETYPCNLLDPASAYRQLITVLTDGFFTCPSRRALRAAAATQTEPVYRYLFTHGPAVHTAEVPYVFGSVATPTPGESTLSFEMQSYWVDLATTGDPNKIGLPTWSPYAPATDNALQLDTPVGAASGIDGAGCNFWDSVQ
jgi:para-nitrobenzyl esterase